jgi:hypothetical protein
MWKVYGEILATADLSSNLRVYQKVIFNRNITVRAMRTSFIVFNDPAFTDVSFNVYSMEGNTPKKLLYQSTNVFTKAAMISDTNGIREVFFEFDNAIFKGTDSYAFVPRGTSYTGTVSSHLAWKRGWPDPVHRLNVTSNVADIQRAPFDLYFIGSEL